jgi:lincosamide nucleotidyltransferase A/C/D/E
MRSMGNNYTVLLKRPVVKATRIAYLGVERSPLAPVLGAPWLRRLKSLITYMPAGQVLALLDAAGPADLRAWVAGGWGVDALAGRQTRRHYDLDLVIGNETRDMSAARSLLAGQGYRHAHVEHNPGLPMPWRQVWQHADGWSVELLPVPLGTSPFSEPGAFTEGAIDGRKVPCLSASLQLKLHSGYPARDIDLTDTGLLRTLLGHSGLGHSGLGHSGLGHSGPP